MLNRLNTYIGTSDATFRLNEVVPGDHPVREVAAVLDLSWVHSELAPYYSRLGRPSIDPVLNAVLGGRNLMTLISVMRTKMASTAACVIANGGSVCVGANAVRAATFTKLCTTKTKTLR